MSPEHRTALLSTSAGLIGVLLGAIASIATTQMHLSYERTKLQIQSIASEQKTFQERAERLFGETSDLVSFFDTNNRYEIREAKTRIAKARRAAFEFAVYASPEMALKAVGTIEAVNRAASAGDSQKLVAALQSMQATTKDLVSTFYKERKAYEQEHSALLK